MEVLTLKGKEYVKASKAAKDLGYSSDYVGQLCRNGSVDAHLVGRTWYVNTDTLGAHRVEKKRNARVKAREHARKSIEAAKSLRVTEDTNRYRNIAIRYEADSKELIPEVRKVSVESHVHPVEREEADETPLYTYENKNEKVILKGTVQVVDAELEEEYTDTTVLRPRIMKRRPRSIEKSTEETEEEVEEQEEEQPRLTFEERLSRKEEEEAAGPPIDALPVRVPQSTDEGHVTAASGSRAPVVLSILIILTLGVLSVLPAQKLTYTNQTTETIYVSDHGAIVDFIKQNKDISDKLDFFNK